MLQPLDTNNTSTGWFLDSVTGKPALYVRGVKVIEAAADGSAIAVAREARAFIPPAAMLDGSTPPTAAFVGTAAGKAFDADDEQTHVTFAIPETWDGASPIHLDVLWTNEASDEIAEDETVIWGLSYRALKSGDVVDQGSAAELDETYTEEGYPAGVDGEVHRTRFTLDPADADQPLTAGAIVVATLSRDKTGDTYEGAAIVLGAELVVSKLGIE